MCNVHSLKSGSPTHLFMELTFMVLREPDHLKEGDRPLKQDIFKDHFVILIVTKSLAAMLLI